MIVDHNNPRYKKLRQQVGLAGFNGAFYYSQELCRNIIPYVYTDRNWYTLRVNTRAEDHSIYFVHNNLHTERYAFLKEYHDIILVCGIPETCTSVQDYGRPIYLPLTIDVDEVEKYKSEKTRKVAFVGRPSKRRPGLPAGIDYIMNLPRERLLEEMARYEAVYAVGRCALEAKVLGCEVLPYDPRFPDPDRWEVMDNSEAVPILQRELDRIDKEVSQ